MKYLNILPTNYIDYLTYSLPCTIKTPLTPGQKIIIPFGRKNITGIFIKYVAKPTFRTKPIIKILKESLITEDQAKILEHLSNYYFCSPAKGLKLLSTIKSRQKSKRSPKASKSNKFILIEKDTKKSYRQILAKNLVDEGQILFVFSDIKNLNIFKELNKHEIGKYNYKVFTSTIKKEEKEAIAKEVSLGKTKLIIGTRAALFLPFLNIKTIIIDRGGEDGHRSEETPRYDSMEISELIAKNNNATLIIHTEVINQDLYIKSTTGYKTIKRAKYSAPKITITKEPHYPIIGNTLENRITNNIANNKKVAIFINNKGSKNILICKDCKNILTCKKCASKLTTDNKTVYCKGCGKTLENMPTCNKCGGIRFFSPGITIKKAISELAKIFPEAKITELSKENKKRQNLINFDIAVGTAYLKNISFKDIETLIILYPENIINIPGYNSDAKALYLLSLLKEKLPDNKKLIIKTSEPEETVIKSLISNKYSEFYREKSKDLKEYGYPPFKDIVKIEIKDKNNKKLFNTEKILKDYFKKCTHISEYEYKNKDIFIKIIFFKSMKDDIFYDTILKSLKNTTIERNPPKGI